MANKCPACLYSEPQSLKEALDFYSKLAQYPVASGKSLGAILEHIERSVSPYYVTEYNYISREGCIIKMIEVCHGLLNHILGKEATVACKRDLGELQIECVTHCANIFMRLMPKLFSTLLFMHFMCNELEFACIGGGRWSSLTMIRRHRSLRAWLTDKDSTSNPSKHKALKAGFHDDDINGNTTVDSLVGKDHHDEFLISHINGGYLQRCMTSMIFLHGWNRGKTAHTLLFLRELIHKLHDATLEDNKRIKNFKDFLSSCYKCHVSIQRLIETLRPVCMQHNRLYHGTLMKEKGSFLLYYNWLDNNISDLIQSLKEMNDDCQQWNLDNLMRGKSYGPFLWGFIFIDSSWVNGQNKERLTPVLEMLVRDLHQLAYAMREGGRQPPTSGEQPSTDTSAAASIATEIHGVPFAGSGASQSPFTSSYTTRMATVVAVGAFFFSIWYLLNI